LGGDVGLVVVRVDRCGAVDITVGTNPDGIAFTPDGTIAYVANRAGEDPSPDPSKSGKVSTIDVATRTKDPTDISGFQHPAGVAVTPAGKTVFVTDFFNSGGPAYVSTIDVATRAKDPGRDRDRRKPDCGGRHPRRRAGLHRQPRRG